MFLQDMSYRRDCRLSVDARSTLRIGSTIGKYAMTSSRPHIVGLEGDTRGETVSAQEAAKQRDRLSVVNVLIYFFLPVSP